MSTKVDDFPSCDKFKNVPKCCATEKTIKSLQNVKKYNCFKNNSNKQKLVTWLLSILYNSREVYNLIRARKMVRKYYNEFKNFCTVLDLDVLVNALADKAKYPNVSGKVRIYLNYDKCNPFSDKNPDKYINLMRLIPLLPSIWGCKTKHPSNLNALYPILQKGNNNIWGRYLMNNNPNTTAYPVRSPFCNANLLPLTDNEKFIIALFKQTDILVSSLSALKRSIVRFAENKDYCEVFRISKVYLKQGESPYKVALTGAELKAVYCLYLRSFNSRTKLNQDLQKIYPGATI